jgi:hypothetical protein
VRAHKLPSLAFVICDRYLDTNPGGQTMLESSELSNQVSMLARMVRARLLKALEAETMEEAHVKIDDAIDGLDTIIEMATPAATQDG